MNLKNFILVIFFTTGLFAQSMAQLNNNFEKNWKNVETFESKGLTKSALQEVMTIYAMAIKENNTPQQIKSCMFQIKYRNLVAEDSHENNIFFVDTLIEQASIPAKNILQSMQAEMLWQYLQNNRWKFYNRSTLLVEKNKDISTWSINKLYASISAGYSKSLNNSNLLKTTRLDEFDPIIIKGVNTRTLRPTLYDFLTHRAIDFFMNSETYLTKPAYQFTISDPGSFASAAEFVAMQFNSKDSASLHNKAILLFQELTKFHLADTNPDALLDIEFKRLAFINSYGVMEGKEKLYEAALLKLENNYPNNSTAAQATYLRALIYFEHGKRYNPSTNTESQFEIKRAREICVQLFAKFPGSTAGINASNLVKQIDVPTLAMVTEKVNIPNLPFRSLVRYKNLNTLYLRIVKTSREELKKLDKNDYSKIWTAYSNMKPLKNWSISLPNLQDYQEHSVEIKLDALPSGLYLILSSADENFSTANNVMGRELTYISDISYINNNLNNYYVLNRNTGEPIANATVQAWESIYNYKTSEYEDKKYAEYNTDKNGYFKLNSTKDYHSFYFQINTPGDELYTDDYTYYSNYSSYEEPARASSFLFTDRSIYRPGQTVYFKGIVLRKELNSARSTILPGYATKIFLRDANSQKQAELSVVTNEYGSYHGSFVLPEGMLNGQFSIVDTATNGFQFISVEEYKRPKFFTSINKPTGTYRVNDSITVTGTAKAYAGNNIDGAKVAYRVVRKLRYPVWWGWYYRGRPSNNSETEISHGTTTTDAKGIFTIIFKALPDESVDKKEQPTFYYELNADVTDINGETRSGNTSVAVAYHMLQLNLSVPEQMPADSFKKLSINSTNLNDIFERSSVNISIQKLQSPNRIFRNRLWPSPDQFLMSKEEFYGYFPDDVYKDEDKMENWPLGEKIYEQADSTVENGQWQIKKDHWETGWYKVIATAKDKYGNPVRDEIFMELTGNLGTEKLNTEARVLVSNATAQPGEQINYSIATGFDKIWLIHTLNKMDKTNSTDYYTINGTGKDFKTVVKEDDRGGIMMNYIFVKHNRVYKGNQYFAIPWLNKQLNISYETFRDKLLPGSAEKWKLKITGSKGEKVNAELLAAMYDASLDQFKPHGWSALDIWPSLSNSLYWTENNFGIVNSQAYNTKESNYASVPAKTYDALLSEYYSGYIYGGNNNFHFGMVSKSIPPPPPPVPSRLEEVVVTGLGVAREKKVLGYATTRNLSDKEDVVADTVAFSTTVTPNPATNDQSIQVRKNFNETAFFFPDLHTDSAGNVEFSFTMPEALTRWKLMTLAHTRDLASGYSEKTTVTQKTLMVQPNAPRFMREGDRMEFSAKIVNLSDSEVTGTAQLELLDAATNTPVDGWFKNMFPNQYFTIAAGQSFAVKFPIEIPFNFNSALSYRIKAITKANTKGEVFSDGEEMAFPVLSNRILVTESMPINMRNQSSKRFRFDKLLNSGNSTTLNNHALTVEYTSNPAWYAVQALPYLMEYPYECAEQTFNRLYANTLASYISRSVPGIKTIFEKWKTTDTAALLSNLQKNEELKSALLQETPWVMDAQNESQQKKNIALLFDMVRMGKEQDRAYQKLNDMQSANGGFVWFKGGPDDRYITQYIVTGIGHLRKLNALTDDQYKRMKGIIDKAIPYLDKKVKEDYEALLKYKAILKNNNLGSTDIQYLYMRSFFPEYKIADASQTAYKYYRKQSQQYWLSNSKYMQAMIALSLYRTQDEKTSGAIIRSLKENSINKEEMGMYWKEWANGGYYWYQSPIESQALMIEAFSDIEKNSNTVEDLKTWLLKQKQTQNWGTTRATAEACYALLLNGNSKVAANELFAERKVVIDLGPVQINSTDAGTEAGTGYFKKRIAGNKVTASMGDIQVSISNTEKTSSSWGSVYWQYFEDMDKITAANTPLKLNKKLFLQKNSDTGPVLVALADGAVLNVGDKVKVRIELKCDRDMEYLHMKDLRAACMEPVNVISQYKYQDGLGYYESTKDASTNFFISWLSRGTYVFEYELLVTHTGNFSNGITSIQCMYAPEFSSHSEGVRVTVE